MLMPKKVKYRKQMRGRRNGKAWRGGDLPVGDPRAFHGFQSVLAERQISAAPGLAVTAAAHLLSVLHFLRHQHRCVLASLISFTASRLQLNALLFFVYTTAAVSRSF